jgi:hypothetical protein
LLLISSFLGAADIATAERGVSFRLIDLPQVDADDDTGKQVPEHKKTATTPRKPKGLPPDVKGLPKKDPAKKEPKSPKSPKGKKSNRLVNNEELMNKDPNESPPEEKKEAKSLEGKKSRKIARELSDEPKSQKGKQSQMLVTVHGTDLGMIAFVETNQSAVVVLEENSTYYSALLVAHTVWDMPLSAIRHTTD